MLSGPIDSTDKAVYKNKAQSKMSGEILPRRRVHFDATADSAHTHTQVHVKYMSSQNTTITSQMPWGHTPTESKLDLISRENSEARKIYQLERAKPEIMHQDFFCELPIIGFYYKFNLFGKLLQGKSF